MKKIELKKELLGSKRSTFDIVKFKSEYSMDEIEKVYKGVKSSMIKYLYSEGFRGAEIFHAMSSKYPKFLRQHSSNVIREWKKSLVKK